MPPLYYSTIAELAPQLMNRKLSPVELTEAILARIETVDAAVNAYITVMGEQALDRARQAEAEIMQGNYRGPLHGIPVGLKDLIYTKGVRTTAGSRVLRDFVPVFDATVVTKLQRAGAVVIGKHNMHEFAAGATNQNAHYGDARNPWDTTRMTGGSSGGSAAAVAAGLCYAAIGSDTGGSIRTPAALCGVVGLKPTYGLVSKHGVVPLAWSLDHLGPMARSVEDVAMVLEAIAGFDKNDPATFGGRIRDYRTGLQENLRGLRIGVPANFFFDDLDSEVEACVKGAIRKLEDLGARATEIRVPELTLVEFCELITVLAEAAAYHRNNLPEKMDLYGDDVRVWLECGAVISAVQYLKAQQARRKIQEAVSRVFQQVDVVVAPTLTTAAPEIGQTFRQVNGVSKDIAMEFVRMAALANLTGIPAVSIPVGFTATNLPIGMQIMGKPFDEPTILRVASAYERVSTVRHRHPME